MKLGDKIESKVVPEQIRGTIVSAPRPPAKWVVEFVTGKFKQGTKSHFKKYYQLQTK